jgi:hypothetical protein
MLSITLMKPLKDARARRRTSDAGGMHRITQSLADANVGNAGNGFAEMRQRLFTFAARGAHLLNANRPQVGPMLRPHAALVPGSNVFMVERCFAKPRRTAKRQITEKVCPLLASCRLVWVEPT